MAACEAVERSSSSRGRKPLSSTVRLTAGPTSRPRAASASPVRAAGRRLARPRVRRAAGSSPKACPEDPAVPPADAEADVHVGDVVTLAADPRRRPVRDVPCRRRLRADARSEAVHGQAARGAPAPARSDRADRGSGRPGLGGRIGERDQSGAGGPEGRGRVAAAIPPGCPARSSRPTAAVRRRGRSVRRARSLSLGDRHRHRDRQHGVSAGA